MKKVNQKVLSSPVANCHVSTSIQGKIIKEWGVWNFAFSSWPGICPRSSFGQRWRERTNTEKWFTEWLRCIICTGGFIWRYRFMELELRYSIMSWFPGQHHLDGCFHLTENKFRNWKPWRVIVGLGSWFLNIITQYFPVWILYPCVPTPHSHYTPTTEREIIPLQPCKNS